jgi:hypothetical protein
MRLRKRSATVAALAITVIAIMSVVLSGRKNEDKEITRKMTDKMMTVCVGRFLIDLPESAEVSFSPARVAGVTVVVEPGYTEAQYTAELGQREKVLSQQKNEYDRPSLEKKIQVSALNFQSTILYYGREKPLPKIQFGQKVVGTEERISVDAFGLYNDFLYTFKAEHFASPRFENQVLELVKKFEARSKHSVPGEPGFCTENGLIHDPIPADNIEAITMFASLKGHPDVAIRLDTSVNYKRLQESLLERDAKNSVKLENPNSVKTFRRQHRPLNGIDGEEVLDKFKEANGTSAHMFMWAGMGKLRDVLAPKVTLELETGIGRPGQPVNSSLSDPAVLELWDKITASIRLRPTSEAAKTTQVDTDPEVPLGELVATGRACPQTGYWQCSEVDAVDGGQPQLFRKGDQMPPAILRRGPNLWQKLSGNVPSHQVTTVWKLVEYHPTPGGRRAGEDQPPRSPKESGSDDGVI